MTRSSGKTQVTPIIPAIPPLTIFGTIENDFCARGVASLISEFPAIATDGTVSVVAAADIPPGMDGIK